MIYHKRMWLPIPPASIQPRVTWTLLLINCGVFILVRGTTDPFVLLDYGATFGPLISDGEYWRLFSGMFLHSGLGHLLMNAIGLLIFGQLVERVYGASCFLAIYVLSGLTGSVTSFVFNNDAIAVGASGAIMGIVGALGGFFISKRSILGHMGRRNLTGVLILAAANLFYGLVSTGIDNWAHLGGFLGGVIMGIALSPRYKISYTALGSPEVLHSTSLYSRIWIIPGVIVALIATTILVSSNMPVTAFSHYYQAHRYFDNGNYPLALDEIDRAISIEEALPDLYLLRGRIQVILGNIEAAGSDLALALHYGQNGDPRTRAEAIRILTGIRAER